MAKWSNIIGSTLGYIRLGLTGVRLKTISGALSVRNAVDTADAVVLPQSLGTGTRDGTKFLRDDGTWQLTPAGSGGVTNFNGRTGDVIAQQSDYDSFFTTATEVNSLINDANQRVNLNTTTNNSNNTTTLSVLDDLTYTVPNDSAWRKVTVYVPFQSAAATTGLRLDFSITLINQSVFEIKVPVSSLSAATALVRGFFNRQPSGSLTTHTGSVIGTGVNAASTTHLAVITGVFISPPVSTPVFTVSFASEVAGSNVTVMQGARAIFEKI